MALNKFKNEKKLIVFFLVCSIVVLGLSACFLYFSTQSDELGGIFISAMLGFISGYAAIVFIARLIKYSFLTKLQNAILVENIRTITVLIDYLGATREKITKEVQFMINSGYLGELKIRDGETIYSDREQARINEVERAKLIKRVEFEAKAMAEKKAEKGSKKQVIKSQKCPNCGAKIDFDETNETNCPYCGNTLTRQ